MEAVRRRSCVPMHASPHLQASLTAARPARSPRTARRAPPLQLNAGRAQTLRAQQHPPKRLQPASPSPPHRAAPAVWQAAPRCCRQATARCACACARPYLPIQLPWDRPAAAARSQSPAAHCIPPPVRRVEGTPGLCSCRTGTHPLPHPPPPQTRGATADIPHLSNSQDRRKLRDGRQELPLLPAVWQCARAGRLRPWPSELPAQPGAALARAGAAQGCGRRRRQAAAAAAAGQPEA